MTTVVPFPSVRRAALTPDDCRWPLPAHTRAALDERIERFLPRTPGRVADPVAPPGSADLLPALTLASAALSGAVTDRALSAAAATALLHRATLPAAAGADAASPALLVAAAVSAANAAGPAVALEVTRALADVRTGRDAADRLRHDVRATPDAAIAVSRGTGGSLLRAACLAGAAAAGLPADAQAALADFGSASGVALGVVDEVLDLMSTPALAGRPVAVDLAAGRMTVPITHALRRRPELAALLRRRSSPAALQEAHVLVLRSGGVAAAVRTAAEHVRSAEQAVRRLEAAGDLDPGPLRRLALWPRRHLDALPRRVVPALRLLLHVDTDGVLA